MWPIKTKEEIHKGYLKEIRRIEGEVVEMECKIEGIQNEINSYNRRIRQLEETAKIFESEGLT